MADNETWHRVRKGGLAWRLRDDAPPGLIDRLLVVRKGQVGEERVIKSNPSRTVCRLEESGKAFYAKWHHFRGLGDAMLACFRGTRARREWRAALGVARCGIATPEPVLLGERRRFGLPVEAFLVTREVKGRSLKSAVNEIAAGCSGDGARRRQRIAWELGDLVRRLHAGGMVHPDLHSDNFILDENDDLVLLDLHAAFRTRNPSITRRVQNLAVLANAMSVPGVTSRDRLRALRAYLGDTFGPRCRVWVKLIDARCAALRRRRIRSRSRRCMLQSSVYTNERTEMGRVYRQRTVSLDRVREAVRLHRAALSATRAGRVLKRDVKTAVTQITLSGETLGELCVKEFIRPGLIHALLPRRLRHKPAFDAWKASLGLAVRGVEGAEALVLVVGRGASSWLIMRCVRAEPLDRYVEQSMGTDRPAQVRRAFIGAAADFLLESYARGVRHRDLKAKNVLVREDDGRWTFCFLDIDAVRFPERVDLDSKVLNLAQINASLPLTLTWTDRLRFLKRLARCDAALGAPAVIQEVGKLTMKRKRQWR